MDESDAARKLASPPLGWMFGDLPAPARRGRRDGAVRRSEGSRGAPERWRLIVHGRVQGVGYRQACCRQAKAMGLGGWVRNLRDGSVEVQAEGTLQALQDLRLWCECGPPGAVVSGVITSLMPPGGDDWFEVRP
jgi:acylphosphatase